MSQVCAQCAQKSRFRSITELRRADLLRTSADPLSFPAAAWYTWRGVVVEGRGVSPDVDVPLSSDELRHGNDNPLNAALDAVHSM
jgi:C-terminal processing protease CtpA/Prc